MSLILYNKGYNIKRAEYSVYSALLEVMGGGKLVAFFWI